jgi:hypothetical protein
MRTVRSRAPSPLKCKARSERSRYVRASPHSHHNPLINIVQNFESAAQDVLSKMQNDPASITSDDANYLKSREARATGQAQPPKDSVSADAQRLASANERGTTLKTGPLDPADQSHLTKERNLEQAVNEIGSKDPSQITQDDANLLHSREQRAHGHTEKGGVASQAKTIANENTRS